MKLVRKRSVPVVAADAVVMVVVAEAADEAGTAVDAAVVADAAAVGIAATAVIAGNGFLLFFACVPRSTGVLPFLKIVGKFSIRRVNRPELVRLVSSPARLFTALPNFFWLLPL